MPAWRDILTRGIEAIENGLFDSEDLEAVFWDAVGQVDFETLLRKRLQVFGAGLLKRNTVSINSADEKLFYAFGKYISERIQNRRCNQAIRAEQERRYKEMGAIRTLKRLKAMTPEEFEYWTGGYFRQYGFRSITVTQISADFGVDVHMTCPDGKKAVVQCKRYDKPTVGRPTVQQTYGAMKLLKARRCYVVTTGRFTAAALELGRRRDIALLDGQRITSKRPPPGSRQNRRL